MTGRLKIVGEKIIDLGNFVAVALIFGQISLEKRELVVMMIGIGLALFFWILGWLILGKKSNRMKL